MLYPALPFPLPLLLPVGVAPPPPPLLLLLLLLLVVALILATASASWVSRLSPSPGRDALREPRIERVELGGACCCCCCLALAGEARTEAGWKERERDADGDEEAKEAPTLLFVRPLAGEMSPAACPEALGVPRGGMLRAAVGARQEGEIGSSAGGEACSCFG